MKTVTPELLADLARVQQNAWGNITLDTVVVDVTMPDGKAFALELQIEPAVIMKGQADALSPGVEHRPEYGPPQIPGEYEDEHGPAIGEVIAYGINEGKCFESTIDTDKGVIAWKVRDATPLREWGVD
jgi:hypothetical protein